jgi:hypothetical protein
MVLPSWYCFGTNPLDAEQILSLFFLAFYQCSTSKSNGGTWPNSKLHNLHGNRIMVFSKLCFSPLPFLVD